MTMVSNGRAIWQKKKKRALLDDNVSSDLKEKRESSPSFIHGYVESKQLGFVWGEHVFDGPFGAQIVNNISFSSFYSFDL